MTKLVKVEIDRLLAAGIIRPSLSEWSSPVVAVLKKDGTARITVNYRKLNSMTVVPQMPLPNIEDMLNSLGGSKVFTVMDVTSGYFTSAIRDEAIPLTAMVTSFGLYEWLRCPQGAAGAPGHFTRLMATVLAGLERVQPFIDDIIVNSRSVGEHLSDLEIYSYSAGCSRMASSLPHARCMWVVRTSSSWAMLSGSEASGLILARSQRCWQCLSLRTYRLCALGWVLQTTTDAS